MEISASLLNVKKEEQVQTFYKLETAHVDYYHIDVMDGKFVKNDTSDKMNEFSVTIKGISNIPLDVHLMVEDIESYVNAYAALEPRTIHFHIEAVENGDKVLNIINKIKEANCKVGIALNPKTEIEKIYEYLPYIHSVLVMSVQAGEGGQQFEETTIQKIKTLKKYIEENNLDTEIEVDGGINLENSKSVKGAGADIIVVGTYLINSKDFKYTVQQLKNV